VGLSLIYPVLVLVLRVGVTVVLPVGALSSR